MALGVESHMCGTENERCHCFSLLVKSKKGALRFYCAADS